MIDRRSLIFGLLASAALPRFSWAAAARSRATDIAFPAKLTPNPLKTALLSDGSLPRADVVIMCDTVAEASATADVLTPGVEAAAWAHYVKGYGLLHHLVGPRGPSNFSKRLGSFCLTQISGKRVLVYKTEMHMHPDAKRLSNGQYTLPIKIMLAQIIDEVQPEVFLTTGTAGGVYEKMSLGDVVVSRAAQFACHGDFAKAPFNGKKFQSDWEVPTGYVDDAHTMMHGFSQHLVGDKDPRGTPPSADCATERKSYPTRIYMDGQSGIPEFHPILTTDTFEFGTTVNRLDKAGMAVEMDDAVLGLVCSETKSPLRWACVRNLSDPTINGALAKKMQGRCAEYYYSKFGYWTTVNSALASWAIVAGLR